MHYWIKALNHQWQKRVQESTLCPWQSQKKSSKSWMSPASLLHFDLLTSHCVGCWTGRCYNDNNINRTILDYSSEGAKLTLFSFWFKSRLRVSSLSGLTVFTLFAWLASGFHSVIRRRLVSTLCAKAGLTVSSLYAKAGLRISSLYAKVRLRVSSLWWG